MCWGQNPAVGGPNADFERAAIDKLDWLVCVDLWETDTSVFWKRPGVNPADNKTEVFLLPASAHFEKEGSVTNSGRWMQWRYKGADSPGDALPDLDIMNELGLKIKELYAAGGKYADGINGMTWGYGHPADPHMVAKEVNGYDIASGKLLVSFGKLKDDGSTSSGNWLYCASYTENGNMAARRDLDDGPFNVGLHPKWAWCWPVNRRVIYNRASVDLNGIPWDKDHPVVWWKDGKWVGDVPDGGWPPMAVDPAKTKYPFIMKPEGHARLFGMGRADGPFPEHYEPWESPVNNIMSGTETNPTFLKGASADSQKGDKAQYPYVATTYRVVEHWQAGAMTRNLPWLVELMPDMFVEISEELAAEKGIANGHKLIVESARGKVDAVAVVTKRLRPLNINGETIHEVGLPWHWGYAGLSTGSSANSLTPHVGDANTMIPEYKAFLCNVRKA
jgi:formate dehydrogenase major subunit